MSYLRLGEVFSSVITGSFALFGISARQGTRSSLGTAARSPVLLRE